MSEKPRYTVEPAHPEVVADEPWRYIQARILRDGAPFATVPCLDDAAASAGAAAPYEVAEFIRDAVAALNEREELAAC